MPACPTIRSSRRWPKLTPSTQPARPANRVGDFVAELAGQPCALRSIRPERETHGDRPSLSRPKNSRSMRSVSRRSRPTSCHGASPASSLDLQGWPRRLTSDELSQLPGADVLGNPESQGACPDEGIGFLGERQMRIYPWGKLPACRLRLLRKLEAYATVRNQLPLALTQDEDPHSPNSHKKTQKRTR